MKKITIITNSIILCFFVALSIIAMPFKSTTVVSKTNPNVIYFGNKQNNNVSFMVNVYWGNEYIEDMLDVFDLYNVKTRKIILFSNSIATSSDIISTAIHSSRGDVRALKNFDLGGFLATLYRLTTDIYFIQRVKEEFIFGQWEKIMSSNDNILKI